MSNISLYRQNNIKLFVMERNTADDIIELYEILKDDIESTPYHDTYRAMINTKEEIYTLQQASSIVSNYSIIGKLPRGNYRIALLIHGNPFLLAEDAQVNWQKGGLASAWSVLEGILQVADAVNASQEASTRDNAILRNPNVEIIYGEEKAQAWLRLNS